jgi:lysine-N-methylase
MADPVSVRVAFSGRSATPSESARESMAAMPTFSQLESEFGGRTAEFDELFVRYFRVKLQGLHFCGRAFYDMSFIDGFRSLTLMHPATLWVARIRAARGGRSVLSLPDVQAALATIDHNFGYSPALGMAQAKKRIRQLAAMQQIPALCSWYSR